MSRLLATLEPISSYKDRAFRVDGRPGSLEEYVAVLKRTTTLYVGNLAFHTTEEQVYELFGACGPVRRVVMGLDKNTRTPCGFCFVEYFARADAEDCVHYLTGARLDEREIRIDFDWGFVEGRQFGRGKHGGQVRDEYRVDYDTGRGGHGKLVAAGLGALRQGEEEGGAPPASAPPPADEARGTKRGRDDGDAANPRFARGEAD